VRLLDVALLKRFAEVGSQEGKQDPLVLARFFHLLAGGHWYATEYDPETRLFFGYVSIFGDHNDEWGYFSLEDLESYEGLYGFRIERDPYWKEGPATQAIPGFRGFGK
jgi:hypothetical protein